MATLVVLKFSEADGAYRMLDKLEDLQKQELIHTEDTRNGRGERYGGYRVSSVPSLYGGWTIKT